jgi:hypothetical protein
MANLILLIISSILKYVPRNAFAIAMSRPIGRLFCDTARRMTRDNNFRGVESAMNAAACAVGVRSGDERSGLNPKLNCATIRESDVDDIGQGIHSDLKPRIIFWLYGARRGLSSVSRPGKSTWRGNYNRISRHCAGLQIPLTQTPDRGLLSSFPHLIWTCYRRFSTCSRHPAQTDSTPSKHGEIHPRPPNGIGEIGRFTLYLGR